MLSLLCKDLRAIRLYAAVFLPVSGLMMAAGLVAGRVFVLMAFAMAASLITAPLAADWSARADQFIHSLPVRRTDVVRARYASAAAGGVIAVILGAGLALAFGVFVRRYTGIWPAWIAVDTALGFVSSVAVFIAVLLWGAFRFGAAVGGVISACVSVAALPLAMSRQAATAAGDVVAALGAFPATVLTLGGAALAVWFSMRLAISAHARREF